MTKLKKKKHTISGCPLKPIIANASLESQVLNLHLLFCRFYMYIQRIETLNTKIIVYPTEQ